MTRGRRVCARRGHTRYNVDWGSAPLPAPRARHAIYVLSPRPPPPGVHGGPAPDCCPTLPRIDSVRRPASGWRGRRRPAALCRAGPCPPGRSGRRAGAPLPPDPCPGAAPSGRARADRTWGVVIYTWARTHRSVLVGHGVHHTRTVLPNDRDQSGCSPKPVNHAVYPNSLVRPP